MVEAGMNNHARSLCKSHGRRRGARRTIASGKCLGGSKSCANDEMLARMLYPRVRMGMRKVCKHGIKREWRRKSFSKDGVQHGNKGDDGDEMRMGGEESAEGDAELGQGKRPEELDCLMHDFDGGDGVAREKLVVEPVAGRGA